MRKRLLVVSDYYLPHWTGIVKTIAYMNDEMKKWFEITVLTTQHDKKLAQEGHLRGVRVIRAPVLISLSRTQFAPSFFVYATKLVSQSDIVFANSPSAYMAYISLIAKLFKKKLFIFHQGDLILPQGFWNRVIEKLFDLSCFISFSLADSVFCATKDYAQNSRILKYFIKKFREFPILAKTKTAPLSLNKKMKNVAELKKQGYVLFGFAGRFVEEKGFDLLLEAIPHVVKKNSRIHFVFAGELHVKYEDFFEKNKSLYEIAKSRITATGVLNDRELEEFYSLADAVVIPSRSDCFPTVQVEAMLRKKPVIVTDIPGARVPVKKTESGIIVPPNDVGAITDAILRIAQQKERYLKFYGNVLHYFNLTRDAQTVKRYLEV